MTPGPQSNEHESGNTQNDSSSWAGPQGDDVPMSTVIDTLIEAIIETVDNIEDIVHKILDEN